YSMKYEAIKHQGKKGGGNSLDEVGEAAGESGKTVQRYIWLARLSDELLDMVDKKKIGLVQGVDLSFLDAEAQQWVQVILEETGVVISTAQSAKLKEYGKNGELTLPMVRLILTEEKPKERKVTIKPDKISEFFAENYSSEDIENIIYQLLEEWSAINGTSKQ
ncbi:MAG: chromosome partitioning protein ParB, partial [Lachnospiraceae bacterium]